MKIKFNNIVIIILIVTIVLMRMFQPKTIDLKEYIKIGGKKYELLSKKVDTVYIDTTTYIAPYIPKPQPPIIIEVPIDVEIDTLAILKDYYVKNIYKDTIKIDSIGYAYINDVVSENKIMSRFAKFNYKIPVINNTSFVKKSPVNKVFIGGELGFNKTNFLNHFSVNTLLLTKLDKVYGLQIGAMNQQTEIVPFVAGSIYWKISLRRKR